MCCRSRRERGEFASGGGYAVVERCEVPGRASAHSTDHLAGGHGAQTGRGVDLVPAAEPVKEPGRERVTSSRCVHDLWHWRRSNLDPPAADGDNGASGPPGGHDKVGGPGCGVDRGIEVVGLVEQPKFGIVAEENVDGLCDEG